MTTLKELQQNAGAVFEQGDTPISFGQSSLKMNSLDAHVFLCDRSNWGLLSLRGEDRARFLHNQTTNNIQSLKTGQGCDTVFVNSTGRNIDLATAYIQEQEILLLVSPQQNQNLFNWMDRYIFPFDKVQLKDLTNQYAIFTLMGKSSSNLIKDWVDNQFLTAPEYSHQYVTIDDTEILITVGCGLKFVGYNLIIPQEKAAWLWEKLHNKNPQLIGSQEFESLRIHQGRPKPEAELTEEYNPLESGLWHAISFDKGCYIGQETIARLNTYQGVKQRLWGINLNQGINPQTDNVITIDGEKVGKITSYEATENFALGYIRTKIGGKGLTVKVGNAQGEVVALPFIQHEYYQGSK